MGARKRPMKASRSAVMKKALRSPVRAAGSPAAPRKPAAPVRGHGRQPPGESARITCSSPEACSSSEACASARITCSSQEARESAGAACSSPETGESARITCSSPETGESARRRAARDASGAGPRTQPLQRLHLGARPQLHRPSATPLRTKPSFQKPRGRAPFPLVVFWGMTEYCLHGGTDDGDAVGAAAATNSNDLIGPISCGMRGHGQSLN